MPSPFTSTEAMCTKLPLLRLVLLGVVGMLCQLTAVAQWQRAVVKPYVPDKWFEVTEIYIANNDVVLVAGVYDSVLIARSLDSGRTYSTVFTRKRSTSVISTFSCVNDSLLFAGGENVFLVSNDTGRSWHDAAAVLPDSIADLLFASNYKITAMASYDGQYSLISGFGRSYKGFMLRFRPKTNSWESYEFLYPFDGMIAVNEGVVYAHYWDMQAYKSVDTGSTFSLISRYPFDRVYELSFSDSIVGRAAAGWIWSTQDGGATWLATDVCRFGCSSVVFVDTLYGWTSGSKALHRTTDGGLTWQDQTGFIDTRPEPANRWRATHLVAIDSINAIFGGDHGLWVTFNGGVGTTSVDPSGDLTHPKGLQLSPNPAIDDITITTPTASTGRVLIVDQAGRTVYERVVESTSSTDHPLRVSTDQFQRGVYLVLFQSADGVVAEKLLVSW